MTTEADPVALATTAPLVFAGSIARSAGATGREGQTAPTAVVSVERAWRTPLGLSLRQGQEVTVRLRTPLAPGRYAFFAALAAVADELEVVEEGHLDASTHSVDDRVADAVQQAYATQMRPRVAAAHLIVLAKVGSVQTLTQPEGQDDESVSWASAPLEVQRFLKRERSRRSVTLIGPRRPSRAYPRAPALRAGREAVFLLGRPPAQALAAAGRTARANLFFVADTADIQPADAADAIAALVGNGEGRAE
jgi:hypothetical protein